LSLYRSISLYPHRVYFCKPSDTATNQYLAKTTVSLFRDTVVSFNLSYTFALQIENDAILRAYMWLIQIPIRQFSIFFSPSAKILACFCQRHLLNYHTWQIGTGKHKPIKHLLVKAQVPFSGFCFLPGAVLARKVYVRVKQQSNKQKYALLFERQSSTVTELALMTPLQPAKIQKLVCTFMYQSLQFICYEEAGLSVR